MNNRAEAERHGWRHDRWRDTDSCEGCDDRYGVWSRDGAKWFCSACAIAAATSEAWYDMVAHIGNGTHGTARAIFDRAITTAEQRGRDEGLPVKREKGLILSAICMIRALA